MSEEPRNMAPEVSGGNAIERSNAGRKLPLPRAREHRVPAAETLPPLRSDSDPVLEGHWSRGDEVGWYRVKQTYASRPGSQAVVGRGAFFIGGV